MGIVIEADEVLDKSRLGSSVGPTVLFNSFTESTAEWKGSVALAVNMPEEDAQKVIIAYGVGSNASKDVGGNVIASLAGWSVVRCAHFPPCCQKRDGPSRPADIPPPALAAQAPLLSTTASTAPCQRTSHNKLLVEPDLTSKSQHIINLLVEPDSSLHILTHSHTPCAQVPTASHPHECAAGSRLHDFSACACVRVYPAPLRRQALAPDRLLVPRPAPAQGGGYSMLGQGCRAARGQPHPRHARHRYALSFSDHVRYNLHSATISRGANQEEKSIPGQDQRRRVVPAQADEEPHASCMHAGRSQQRPPKAGAAAAGCAINHTSSPQKEDVERKKLITGDS